MKHILVLSDRNSCRSLMAQGWLSYYGKGYVYVESAGLCPTVPDPLAVEVMNDAIIDISNYTSKAVKSLLDSQFHFLILLSSRIDLEKIHVKGDPEVFRFDFPDISQLKLPKDEKMNLLLSLRDEIENYCFDFIHQKIRPLI